jgi:SAM-dependent methyltransferase
MNWLDLWNRKGAAAVARYDLEALIGLDGFDAGAGRLTAKQFCEIAAMVSRELGLRQGMRVLEVGCGAGALLWCLRHTGARLFGVDYSERLVDHARRAIPEGTFAVAEADRLPFEADAIVCHSVFQYFPDFEYARRVLEGFRRAAPTALILDVPDLATREACERARREAGSKPGGHLYYPRGFFAGARVWSNELEGYGNAAFRFHARLCPRAT